MAGDGSGGAGGAALAAAPVQERPQQERQEEKQQDEHLVERSKEMAQHLRHDPPKGVCRSSGQRAPAAALVLMPPHLAAELPSFPTLISLPQAWTAAVLCR